MKKKLLAVLSGIASLAIAGLISIIPASVSQAAAPVTFTYDEILILDANTLFDDVVPGTVTFTVYNYDPSSNSELYYFAEIGIDGDETSLQGVLVFDNVLDTNTYGFLSVDVRYNGVDYIGSIYLNNMGDALYNQSLNPFLTDAGFAKAFNKSISSKVNDINLAAQGLNADGSSNPEKTVEYKYNYAINYTIIQAVANAKDVTLLYTFEYEGHIFQSTITSEQAAKVFTPEIPWYGPCYIASNFPTVYLGEAA